MRLACVVVLAACNSAPLDPSLSQLVSGVYYVTSTLQSNDCQPAPGEVTDEQGIVDVASQGINLPLPVPGGFEKLDIIGAQRAYTEVVCGALRTWQLERPSSDELTVQRTATWTVAGVDRSCQGAAVVPVADCSSADEVQYRLKQPCACHSYFLDLPEVACNCP